MKPKTDPVFQVSEKKRGKGLHMELILASGSPRRAKILKEHQVRFTVLKSDAPEISDEKRPEFTVMENARRKGEAVLREHPGESVLAADTIVYFGGRIYGKPMTREQAKRDLQTLSGKTHLVLTGVYYNGKTVVEKSEVVFKTIDDATIDRYIELVNPVDRAGAYDIDTCGEMVVDHYNGEYENIMGLPLRPLREWGIL